MYFNDQGISILCRSLSLSLILSTNFDISGDRETRVLRLYCEDYFNETLICSELRCGGITSFGTKFYFLRRLRNKDSHFVKKDCSKRMGFTYFYLHIFNSAKNRISSEDSFFFKKGLSIPLMYSALLWSLQAFASESFCGLNKRLSKALNRIDIRAHIVISSSR